MIRNFLFFIVVVAFASTACEHCPKKVDNYYLTDTAKSWISAYANTTVTFKNQLDSVVTFNYSNPVDTMRDYYWDADKLYCILYHYEYITMTLNSETLPYFFPFTLQASTVPGGSEQFVLIGDDGAPTHGTFTVDHSISIKLFFEDQTIRDYNQVTFGTALLDSVNLNGSVFYNVYSDVNTDSIKYPNIITAIYFNKQLGVIGFTTNKSETWVLQP